MRYLKIISINLLVLLTLIVLIEISFRSLWTLKQCFGQYTNGCDFKRLLSLKIRENPDGVSELYLGLTQYDQNLGFVYTPGFEKKINTPINEKYIQDWKDVDLKINSDGFRSNDNNLQFKNNSILAVGDSFTFGSQVNNNETWPSCLERKLNVSVKNAGVAGYGAAQSVRRAEIETEKNFFDTIILGILVGEDYERDQYIFRWGFPKPAVIKVDNLFYYSDVPKKKSLGTKYMPNRSELINFAYSYSQIFTTIYDKVLGRYIDITGMRKTEKHINAASIDEIINFTIEKFSNIESNRKYILLQYQLHDFYPNKAFRKMIKNLADKTKFLSNKKGIVVIDTYPYLDNFLKKNNENIIFQKHHTAFGNEFVCSVILKNFF